ncbi:hypothetical protein GW17_00042897 [Ensete ventricosum]|nr:hypothetical protein GW17_00042897 [Ensete ventricosum]
MSNMGSEAEPAKLLLPYLQRADELQKHEPLVAYYCTTVDCTLWSAGLRFRRRIEPRPPTPSSFPSWANSKSLPDKQDRAGRADLYSYPSFHDSTFPAAPTQQPSYYHAHDSAYSQQPAPVSHYTPSVQYASGSVNQNHAVQAPPSAERYKYDSNYQPSAEKIAEAHKAARFAVGALAFDDVSVAVDFLQRSLELLTNPSAQTH